MTGNKKAKPKHKRVTPTEVKKLIGRKWITAKDIARKLKTSVHAVRYAIRLLRADKKKIVGERKHGYRLA